MIENTLPPIVSILLPAWNAERFVGETIAAALAQRFTDFELLVLDNASTDATGDVVAGFHDKRLRYVRNASNIGYAGNVQRGRALACGRYVVVLNADDVWEADYLARAVELMEHEPSLAMIHAGITLVDADGNGFGEAVTRWRQVTPAREAFLHVFLAGFSSPTMLMRNALLQAVPPLPQAAPWARSADTWLFLQLCLRGDVGYIGGRMMRYRVHESSMMFASYADGSFFRSRLATASDAFMWPQVRDWITTAQRRRVLRHVAREAITILPITRRQCGRLKFLRAFAAILALVPSAALAPSAWLRLLYGLLPRSIIEALRTRKRHLWKARQIGLRHLGAGVEAGV
jgi:glycosyltransferase involved in cell wall biosynthesis